MEILSIITAICLGCKNIKDFIHVKTIKSMSIFGTWRYYWLRDNLERNPGDHVHMNTFITFLEEKQKIVKASDDSIEQLCHFIDLYKKYHKDEDECLTISVIYEFIQNIRGMNNNSLLWILGKNLLKIAVKQKEVSDIDMEPAIVERNKAQITELCYFLREVCEAVGEDKTNQVLFAYEFLKFAYNHWRFDGFPKLAPFSDEVQERLTRGEIHSPIFQNDNLFYRMKTYHDRIISN